MRHIQQRNAAAPGKAVESLVGFEPTTRCLEGSRSVRLSYRDPFRPILQYLPPKRPAVGGHVWTLSAVTLSGLISTGFVFPTRLPEYSLLGASPPEAS